MVAATDLPVVSAVEVRENAHAAKALVVVDGLVYDLTDFLPTHPGGEDIVFPHLGTDVSAVFRGKANKGDHAHSNAAVDMLQTYCVGRLEGAGGGGAAGNGTSPAASSTTSTSSPTGSKTKPSAANGDKTTLDLSKPLVCQVASLGKNYNDYVHRPQHLKQPARFFQNNFLEFCSRTPWYVIPLIWWPVVACELIYTVKAHGVSPLMCFACFVYGVFSWTLIEYVLHRFLFHISEKYVHMSRFTITFHFLIHGCHHLLPMDNMRLVFPPVPAAIIMVFVYSTFRFFFGACYAFAMLGGATFGYTLYDVTHYYLHHGVPLTEYFRSIKSYHLAHHYKNSVLGFGISSKLWDVVFSTELK